MEDEGNKKKRRKLRNRFQRLPTELKYKIFARLDMEDLLSAKRVCRDWSELLSQVSIEPLIKSLRPLSQASPQFLVRVVIRPKNTKRNTQPEDKILLSIDHHARIHRHHHFDNVDFTNALVNSLNLTYDNLHRCFISLRYDTACNGMFFAFSSLINYDHIAVCNSSMKLRACVPCYPSPRFCVQDIALMFQAAFHDPYTSHFTLLIGCLLREGGEPDSDSGSQSMYGRVCRMHLYSSESKQWRTMTTVADIRPYGCTGVFSQGWFFWINMEADGITVRGVTGFNLKNEEFHNINLPKCPFEHNATCTRRAYGVLNSVEIAEHGWALKGCHENLVLVHSKYDREFDAADTPIFAWKLISILNDIPEKWQWQSIHSPVNSGSICKFPFFFNLDVNFYFDTNKSGWWLWAEKCKSSSKETQEDLQIFDPHGQLRHTVSMSDLASFLTFLRSLMQLWTVYGHSSHVTHGAYLHPLDKNLFW